jgi:hypothetical protein
LVLGLLPALASAADERHAVAFDLGAAELQYHKKYRVAVSDVPGHVLRLQESSREFVPGAFTLGTVAVVSLREWGTADLIDENGTESAYLVFTLADGNRVLGRYRGTIESRRWPDGSRHYDLRGTVELTGGSGAFETIRGTIRTWQAVDPGADSNQGRAEGEVWFERR